MHRCDAFILKDFLVDEVVKTHNEHDMCHWINGANQDSESCSAYWGGGKPPVVLISMDGFRPEYLKRSRLDGKGPAASTILCLARSGVRVPFMMPSYPTITFPNHYSIVTGLYPESHGIIHNRFYDPDLKAYFNIRSPDMSNAKWWRNGEPIWATAKRQGRISATYFWPGSDVKDDILAPNYRFKYNKSTPFEQRVDQILNWLDLPIKERPNILTLYFEEPDSTGHKFGPNTQNVQLETILQLSMIKRGFPYENLGYGEDHSGRCSNPATGGRSQEQGSIGMRQLDPCLRPRNGGFASREAAGRSGEVCQGFGQFRSGLLRSGDIYTSEKRRRYSLELCPVCSFKLK